MAAIIVRRPRLLRKTYESIPKKKFESKFYNSSDQEIDAVLERFAEADVKVVYSVVDKYDYKGRFYNILGNDLYKAVLAELLDGVGSITANSDADLMLDRCRFLTIEELRFIAST